ncbi:putative bifunctional diguanylate cyclase/phosphodiesterase [Aquipuribacter sp. SD81]|uniref:putative bifunctional diguanylate cyclase/phosphodiesterase n=1 Tax=Aquipuribacter sp. SD81 TaxID=3127703 RepID=UPI00301A32D8
MPSRAPSPASGGEPVGQRAMGRALGLLYLSGSALALLWTLLPHGPTGGDAVVRGMALLAATLGASLAAGAADRAPRWVFHLVIGCIQLVISVAFAAVGLAGAADNDIRLFYLWATPFAAFFFSPRAALRHGLWTATCLAVSLSLLPAPAAVQLRVWLMTAGTLAAVGLLVGAVAAKVHAAHAALQHAAWHDGLSGLANRGLFERRVNELLRRRDALGGAVHVLLVDLDRFKLVNDTYGHHTGDALIVAVSQRLRARLPASATIARMGGDEFAVVVASGVGPDDVAEDVEPDRVLAALTSAWHAPVRVGVTSLPVSGTVGVVTATAPGRTAESLLRDADVALYRAKHTARGTVRRFDGALREEVERRARIDAELGGALERGELRVAYQPVVDLVRERTGHVEALARWSTPTLGEVPPAEFVAVAEENRLIGAVGQVVLERAAGDLAAWRAVGHVDDDFGVAVHVSAGQLDEDFPGLVEGVLRRHRLPGRVLHLEVTESAVVGGTAGVAGEVLARVRALGVRVALDDFGTGFSSLSYLQRLPLDTLKVDRSFVAELGGPAPRTGLVAAVLDLARGLDLDVVAEGVETAEQADRLRALGVRWAQGRLFGRPVPAEELLAHLAGGRTVPVPRAGG